MGSINMMTAFSAEFSHEFYTTVNKYRVNNSLAIQPSDATAAILKGARMVFRATPKGFKVMFATYPDPPNSTTVYKPFVKLADTDMTFVMRLNPRDRNEFMNYTKLYLGSDPANPTTLYAPDKIVYLSASAPGAMTYSLLDQLRPDLFTYDFQVAGSNAGSTALVELKYENESFTTLYSALPNSNGVFSAQVDLRGMRKGKYTIQASITSPVAASVTTTVYVDKDLYGTDLFGIVKLPFESDVYPDTLPTPAAPPVYTYEFIKRVTKWRYYVVSKSTIPGGTVLKINDSAGNYDFTQEGGTPHGTIKIDGKDTVVLISSARITGLNTDYVPFYEEARSTFELRNETGTPVSLVKGLQNPALAGFDSDRYAQLTNVTPEKSIEEMFVFIEGV